MTKVVAAQVLALWTSISSTITTYLPTHAEGLDAHGPDAWAEGAEFECCECWQRWPCDDLQRVYGLASEPKVREEFLESVRQGGATESLIEGVL